LTASLSVIIPTYNRGLLLGGAIRSALAQMGPGDELIVVDDGSTDDTRAVVDSFGDRVTYVCGQHRGAGPARNLGIAHAHGDLVAFLDSDDEWLPGTLAGRRAFMEARPDVLFSFTDFRVVKANRTVEEHYLRHWEHDPRSFREMFGAPSRVAGCDADAYVGDLYRWQLTGLYILTDTLMVRREAAGDALRYGEVREFYEDLHCFIRLSSRGKAAYIDMESTQQTEFATNRLTGLSPMIRLRCQIEVLESTYGGDAEFLARHGDLYRQTMAEKRLKLLKARILTEDFSAARETLEKLPAAPLSIRLLLRSPDMCCRALVRLYQHARALVPRS